MSRLTFASIYLGCVLAGASACGSSGGQVGPGSDASGQTPDAALPDRDNDGLSDQAEDTYGTDPDNPDTDGDGLKDGDEIKEGTDPLNPDTDGDGILDGDEILLGTDPLTPDAACAGTEAEAEAVYRPTDIVIMVDTSSSMAGEAQAVHDRLNDDLADVLMASNIDYRIILLADFPPVEGPCPSCKPGVNSGSDVPLCIDNANLAPGENCNGSKPVNSNAKFFHYDTNLDSWDSLVQALLEFDDPAGDDGPVSGQGMAPNGWSTKLRAEDNALTFFIEISDDNAYNQANGNGSNWTWYDANNPDHIFSAADFDARLRAKASAKWPTKFPTPADFEYVFHSIIGIDEPAMGDAWADTDPIINTCCGNGCSGNAVNAGQIYQQLSKMTGGLRFPLCNNGNFDTIFQAVAQQVIESVGLPCTFRPQKASPGKELDYDRMVGYYRPDGGGLVRLDLVPSADDCVDDAYYLDGENVILCPSTCDEVSDDESGTLEFHVACEAPIVD